MRRALYAGLVLGLRGVPRVDALHELRIADLQVVVRDPQTAREEIERELRRLEAHVPLGVLEPLQAHLCRALQALDCRPPLGLVLGERGAHVGVAPQRAGQRDRVLDRELGPRANREMRRVRRIAHQHDVAMRPRGVPDGDEVPPQGAILEEAVALELFLEQGLTELDGMIFGGLVQSRVAPRRLGGLHDERGSPRLVLIGVHAPQPVLIALEVEGEGGKGARCPQPHEAVGPFVE